MIYKGEINMIMVYRICKSKIESKRYKTKEEMQEMLDIFFAGERLDVEEYGKLVDILEVQ